MLPSEWVNENVIVTGSRSGLIRLDPYQIDPVNDIADPKVNKITLMWSSQGTGKTTVTNAGVCWYITHVRGSIYLVYYDAEHRKEVVTDRLMPMLYSCKATRPIIKWTRPGSFSEKSFNYGPRPPFTQHSCTMKTSNSGGVGHSATAALVIADETDRYTKKNLLSALAQRTVTYSNQRKLIAVSTPSLEGDSAIADSYMQGSRGERMAVCPKCNEPQKLTLDSIDYKKRAIKCIKCKKHWTEQERLRAVINGFYEHEDPDNPHKSYHVSQLHSMSISLDQTITDIELNKNNPEHVQTQIMAYPYEDVVTPPLDPGKIKLVDKPDFEPRYMAAGIDVQGHRYEWVMVVYDSTFQLSHVCAYGIVPSFADDAETITTVLQHINKKAEELGVKYDVAELPYRIAIDVGYKTQDLLTALERLELDGPDGYVEAVRGLSPQHTGSFDRAVRGTWKVEGYRWVHVDSAKVMINKALEQKRMTVDSSLTEMIVKQLSAEQLVRVQRKGGTLRRRWDKLPGRSNEILDCTVYALAQALTLV